MNSNSYVVLARKWRPAQFSDIVGQGPVVRTLMNAIRSQRIHQAYLFTGSRGIGKTSIARIFAKAIRCENTRIEKLPDHPGQEWLMSCGECANCREISGAMESLDVQEIDGASNNGVEAVREIRTNANFMPSRGSRRIYIIDEVHMLTTAAFNALLKTLEEPPPHVIFIFATTEPHKIPPTILSRCQRFDFRRVSLAQIQQRLTQVCQAEKITTEPGTLALVARAAEGSMRDALSLLDQVIAFAGSNVTVESVRESIGLVEGQTLVGILQGIASRKPLEALKWVDRAYEQGHDLRVLTRSLIEFLHGAILAKVGAPGSQALELSEEEWKELQEIAALRPLDELEMIFQVLHHGLEWIARSPQPKVVLDILLVKCATAEALVFAEASNSPSVPSPSGSTGSGGSVPQAEKPASALPSAKPFAVKAEEAKPQPTPAPSAPRSFEGFIEHVRASRPMLATILEHGSCDVMPTEADSTLKIGFPAESIYPSQLQTKNYNDQAVSLAKEYFGRHVRVLAETREGGKTVESPAARREREKKDLEERVRKTAQNHPIILEAKALFGGELGPIELLGSSENAVQP